FFFKKDNFFFRKNFECTILLPFFKLLQTVNTFLNRLEVSKRTTQPTLVDVEVTATLSFFFNRILSLFFCTNKKYCAAFCSYRFNKVVRFVNFLNCFL